MSRVDPRKDLTFRRSPEDEATYVKWRRGIFIFYGGVGLAVAGVGFAAHFSRLAFQLAGN
jgi:hypothetical protein